MFSTIGIIGSGTVGRALASKAAAAGHRVLITNSRGPASLAGVVEELGEGARAVTLEEAAAADLVILAAPFPSIPAIGEAVGDWSGTVVVDATNQFARSNPYGGRADTGGLTGSEWVAGKLPGATVIKAFNAMFGSYIEADPRHAGGRQIVFYAGDDGPVKEEFARFVSHLGFAPVDVGGLRGGGRLIQLDGPLNGLHALRQD